VAQWLRYWTTNRKVAGSIPDGVIGIFHWHNPSDRTMALGSTQPPTIAQSAAAQQDTAKASGELSKYTAINDLHTDTWGEVQKFLACLTGWGM
jgi:hypothetical protein